MSKGSRPRPYSVTLKEFDSNYDAIFRKADPKEVEDAALEDEAFKDLEQKTQDRATGAVK